jgi:hypothetical protein
VNKTKQTGSPFYFVCDMMLVPMIATAIAMAMPTPSENLHARFPASNHAEHSTEYLLSKVRLH